MLARGLILLLATALLTGQPKIASAQPPAGGEWQVLEPDGEGFRIELPGKPEPQSGELDTAAGKIYVRLYLLTDERRRRIYNITANRLPQPPKEADVKGVLDRTRDGALKLTQGKVLTEAPIQNDRHHGRALTVETEAGLYVQARMYVADDRLYQVSIVSDARELSEEDRRVFSSFQIRAGRLVDPMPQIDWRFVTPRGEKFAVELPDDPHESTGTLDTPLGRVTLTRLECQAAGRSYFVQFCDLPKALVGDDAMRLDAARDHALAATGGKLVEETPLTVAERSGRAAVITTSERTLRLRTLLDGSRVYQLGTIAAGEATADDKRFFESLKLPTRDAK